ncbi:MAG: sterol desaturase family protein [Methylosarcina sp.]
METIIRLSAALGIFFLMATWEYYRPRRPLAIARKQRWPVNLSLAAFNMVLMRLTIGSLAYISAMTAAYHDWGLLNWTDAPRWLSIPISLFILDFAVYWQHRFMHYWPMLWRLHQVHHTDLEFDATTAVRFHPMEILLSMFYKVVCVYLLGADPAAVIAFEIILNGAATFNHSNVNIPSELDRKLRWFLITPDMHRIHHSVLPEEMDNNFGFSISCWDRLCHTYIADPKQNHTTMMIGLRHYRNQKNLRFWNLFLMPFKALRLR